MTVHDPIGTLSAELRVDWPAIHAASQASAARRESLNAALSPYTTEDTSIVVFGSLARGEFTSGSDLDWILLVDGFANPEHLDASLDIEAYLRAQRLKAPGTEATFGNLVFSHDLINYIGGGDDTNANLTRRMLLLLESLPIGRGEAYTRVVNNVLLRYIQEDFGWMNSRNPMNVPRFLQNDMARYWRTLTVDFAYKRRQRAGRGWALRTAKLRLSRKLTYASGLCMCFSCADLAQPANHTRQDRETAALEVVDHLRGYVKQTPLEILASLFLRYRQLDHSADKMFGAYDEFLAILNEDEARTHLDELSQSEVATDSLYEKVRGLSHRFQESLYSVFFDEHACPELYRLTKTYGVF